MKKNFKSLKSNFLFFIFIFIFILGGIFYLIYKYNNLVESRDKILSLEKDIEAAQIENQNLINQMQYQSSDEYIEKLAREQLGMVKSDEIVFIDQGE